MHRHKQTNHRQTGKQSDTQTHKHTNTHTQTHGQAERHTYKHTDIPKYRKQRNRQTGHIQVYGQAYTGKHTDIQ